MQSSPRREAEAPPAICELAPGHRVLLEADVVEAFADECRVSFVTGNLRMSAWVPRKDIKQIIGFDPDLPGCDRNSTQSIHSYLRQRDAAEKEAR